MESNAAMDRPCGFDAERLSAWLDDALAESERRAVAEHLRGCATCRDRVEAFRRVDAEVHDLPTPGWTEAYAPQFTAGVMARIAASPVAAPPRRAPVRRAGFPIAWLTATLSAAAALLILVAGMRLPAPERSAAETRTARDSFASDLRPKDFKSSTPGKGGVAFQGKGGPIVPGKGGSVEDPGQAPSQTATGPQILVVQTGENLGLFDKRNQCNEQTVLKVGKGLLANDALANGCSFRAHQTLNYRGVDFANPALPVDADALADRSLAASEAVMTYLVNSANLDADALRQLRETVVSNGIDDRVRTALTLASDAERARPLEKAQVFFVRLANGEAHADAAELAELKQVIVGEGMIEEVRLGRNRTQVVARAQNDNPTGNDRPAGQQEPIRAK